jgi:hypothetical protein
MVPASLCEGVHNLVFPSAMQCGKLGRGRSPRGRGYRPQRHEAGRAFHVSLSGPPTGLVVITILTWALERGSDQLRQPVTTKYGCGEAAGAEQRAHIFVAALGASNFTR